MATSAIRAVGEAFAAILVADATLAAMLAPDVGAPTEPAIFDDIPDGNSYPLIVIGNGIETPWHTFGGPDAGIGWKVVQRVHIYSRYQGETEALRILERVIVLLNFRTITVTGFSSAACKYERARVLTEDAHRIETRHVPADFVVLVQQ